MEWKLFLERQLIPAFLKRGRLFHFSPPTKQTVSVLDPVSGIRDGPAFPSAWEPNSRIWKSHLVCVRKQQCKDSWCTGRPPCSHISELNLKVVGLNSKEKTDFCVASAAKDLLQTVRTLKCRSSSLPSCWNSGCPTPLKWLQFSRAKMTLSAQRRCRIQDWDS